MLVPFSDVFLIAFKLWLLCVDVDNARGEDSESFAEAVFVVFFRPPSSHDKTVAYSKSREKCRG